MVEVSSFGTTDTGQPVEQFKLARGAFQVDVLTYGARIQSIRVPDREGRSDNVVLGFPTLAGYLASPKTYFGATVGRYANRIANGRFLLDGELHTLSTNDGPNHLHGGDRGFDKLIWHATDQVDGDQPSVSLQLHSPDGDQGYPGALDATVTYVLTGEGTLRIDYEARTSRRTVVSLTNHTLFNLAGAAAFSDVLGHTLQINADCHTPARSDLIPTGEIALVEGTPYDFRDARQLGAAGLEAGYDSNFVLRDGRSPDPTYAARLVEPASGRSLEVWSTEPGLQLYSGGQLNGTDVGHRGRRYDRFTGVALEPQAFPDSPNNPAFPSVELAPGDVYRSATEFRFAAIA